MQPNTYPVTMTVDYPDRPLNRATTFFRIFMAVPILIIVGAVAGGSWQWSSGNVDGRAAVGVGGLLLFAPLLMIVFRRKYPRWWFDWNLELQRFGNRAVVYLALMDGNWSGSRGGLMVC
jgi:hypothetical protein